MSTNILYTLKYSIIMWQVFFLLTMLTGKIVGSWVQFHQDLVALWRFQAPLRFGAALLGMLMARWWTKPGDLSCCRYCHLGSRVCGGSLGTSDSSVLWWSYGPMACSLGCGTQQPLSGGMLVCPVIDRAPLREASPSLLIGHCLTGGPSGE